MKVFLGIFLALMLAGSFMKLGDITSALYEINHELREMNHILRNSQS